jgi:hypothetical protein
MPPICLWMPSKFSRAKAYRETTFDPLPPVATGGNRVTQFKCRLPIMRASFKYM